MEPDRDASHELSAGSFSGWLDGFLAALQHDVDADVPCGGCTACCTSSQFVHIEPDETETLAHIPHVLLFPAPGRPKGHRLMGYDDEGRCPMLIDGACSIYEHRPRTCRTYDCRIFPAAGLEPDEQGHAAIAEQARRWRFEHPTDLDQVRHRAVRAASAFLAAHREVFGDGRGPTNATQLAALAVELHDVFLTTGGDGRPAPADPTVAEVEVELGRRHP